jgi:hypothetical protein
MKTIVSNKNGAMLGLLSAVVIFSIAAFGQPPAQRAAPRGRLPAHYKDLVSPDQRDEIYAIQAKFNSQIDELEAKIEQLKKQRDEEVEGVLTTAQRTRLKLLVANKGKPALDDGGKDAGAGAALPKEKKSVFPK